MTTNQANLKPVNPLQIRKKHIFIFLPVPSLSKFQENAFDDIIKHLLPISRHYQINKLL